MNFYEFVIKLCQVFVNDKILVIAAVTGITMASILKGLPSTDTIVTSAFTGLFGIAVGMAMRRKEDMRLNEKNNSI